MVVAQMSLNSNESLRAILDHEMSDAVAAAQAKDFDGAARLLEVVARKLKSIADGHDGGYPHQDANG